MAWLARLFMLVPAMVAGWFVSREDPRFWVVALVVGLVFLFMLCLTALYGERLAPRRRKQGK